MSMVSKPVRRPSVRSSHSLQSLPSAASLPVVKDEPEVYSNFTLSQRALLIAVATWAATFSGLASNIYFPAIPTIAHDLGTTIESVNLSVTSYMILQAISPTFWGALSDAHGRRLTLIATLIVFLAASVGLALLHHLYELIILRCLQSAGSASTISIGAGIIGDVTTRAERGSIMGIFQGGLLLPMALGPVLGGVFSKTLGWRAIFWFLVIYAFVFILFLFIILPETLRTIVGNGSKPPHRLAKAPLERLVANREHQQPSEIKPKAAKVKIDFIAPIRILFVPEVFGVLLFLSIHYASWQSAVTAQSSLLTSEYGLGQIQVGLTFLANGAGCILGTLTTGRILDHDYAKIMRSYKGLPEDFPIEQARLRTVWLWSPLSICSLLTFAWTIDKTVHISVPLIASFFLAWSAMSAQSVINTFLVDIFPKSSASATAALNLARCLMGAGATAAVEPLNKAIGVGWTFTLFSGLMALSLSLVAVQMKWGMQWRRKREIAELGKLRGDGAEE